jgi:hypothetical protein
VYSEYGRGVAAAINVHLPGFRAVAQATDSLQRMLDRDGSGGVAVHEVVPR